MQASAIAGRLPAATGWCVFYLGIAAAWAGLVAMSAANAPMVWPNQSLFAGFLARCLESVASLSLLHLVAMWALMSLGMMLPTAFPALQRLADLLQARPGGAAQFLSFCLAYVAVWLSFSLIAALAQMLLTAAELVDAAGRLQSDFLVAGLLGFAGAYQFTKLKHACLSRCRHPMTFFLAQWRDGLRGAAIMGLKHGRDCLGCCWPLMLLAFVGGTMNLGWMALAMILMLIEKLAGPGRFVTLPLGIALILSAGYAFGIGWQSL
jgi:predicted metal-binding membrane protein